MCLQLLSLCWCTGRSIGLNLFPVGFDGRSLELPESGDIWLTVAVLLSGVNVELFSVVYGLCSRPRSTEIPDSHCKRSINSRGSLQKTSGRRDP